MRWIAVWTGLAVWFAALVFGWGGSAAHLLLVVALTVLVYELLAIDPSAS
ncbi:MAG: hypothetical protein AABZ26_03665 [Chloroflexota bacterium]